MYPFQLATSPTAVKAYLTTALFLFTSFVLLSISTTAYAFFYYNYIPQTDLERPIYLQYDLDQYPMAEIQLDPSVLISQQPYDVSVTLHMPHGPVNKASGNFMLDLTLHGKKKKDTMQSTILEKMNMDEMIPSPPLHSSRRPALVPYSSLPASLARKIIYTPLHILTSSKTYDPDSVTLTVPMFEEIEFARGKDNIPTHAKLVIQTQRPSAPIYTASSTIPIPHLEVYSAKLTFQVRFHGLRYLVYNHRILSFLIFSSIFYGVSISTVAVVWAVLAMLFRTDTSSPSGRALIKTEKSPTIKQEPDVSDPLGTASDYTVQTVKRLSDESEDNAVTGETARGETLGYTPQTSEAASIDDSAPLIPVVGADASEEQADDEEEQSEDEWEQLQRLRRRMEKDARERERQVRLEREQDSGLGTSLESGGAGVVRRGSTKRGGSGRE